MDLDFQTGFDLAVKAREKNREDRIFQQWVAQLPFMGEPNFISFDDYRDRVTGANIDTRSTAEILADLEDVEREFREGGDDDGA